MELALFVWLASVVGGIATFVGITGSVLAVGTAFVYGVKYLSWADFGGADAAKPSFKFHATGVLFGLVLIFVANLIPSQKTMYLMAGAWAGQAVVQSETADKVLKIVNGKLDEYLIDMEKSVKEEVKK